MGRKTYKNRWKKNLLTFFSIFFILLSACGSTPPEAEAQSGSTGKIEELEVHFIDVGQGDATLVKCGGQSMLIDAGEMIKALLYRIILGNRV